MLNTAFALLMSINWTSGLIASSMPKPLMMFSAQSNGTDRRCPPAPVHGNATAVSQFDPASGLRWLAQGIPSRCGPVHPWAIQALATISAPFATLSNDHYDRNSLILHQKVSLKTSLLSSQAETELTTRLLAFLPTRRAAVRNFFAAIVEAWHSNAMAA